jgi:transcriptional regulator with XRE-family HTH domain
MNDETLARQLVRALRGKRSQTALSRRLGYRSNVLYMWESGANFPTAATFFRAARSVGVDVTGALAEFYRRPPSWLTEVDLATAAGAARLLDDLRGNASIVSLASSTKRSRFAIARWLKGTTEPRLPDLLRMIEASTLRLLDFLAAFVDPARLPHVARDWHKLETARRAAFDMPWSHAVLRVLELREYRDLKTHVPGWIASKLGIAREEEERCLKLLVETGQIHRRDKRYRLGDVLTVDTRHDPSGARKLAAFWARVGAERLRAGSQGNFAYNLFGVSNADLERLRELQRGYFAELRAIVANSQPVERVVLANMQLFTLERDPPAP